MSIRHTLDLNEAARDAFAAFLDASGWQDLADIAITNLATLCADALEIVSPDDAGAAADAYDLAGAFRQAAMEPRA